MLQGDPREADAFGCCSLLFHQEDRKLHPFCQKPLCGWEAQLTYRGFRCTALLRGACPWVTYPLASQSFSSKSRNKYTNKTKPFCPVLGIRQMPDSQHRSLAPPWQQACSAPSLPPACKLFLSPISPGVLSSPWDTPSTSKCPAVGLSTSLTVPS